MPSLILSGSRTLDAESSIRALGLTSTEATEFWHAGKWTKPETSNTTADLRGIHSVGGGVTWASGTNGTVLRTEDGGFEWQTCSMPPGAEKLDFRGIQAFDANTAIVMSSGKGDLSRLYKTTDGCASWKLIYTNPDADGFWDALAVVGKDLMLLGDPVGGSFVLEKSQDAGATWKREQIPPSESAEGAFAASNSSLVLGDNGRSVLFGTGGPEGARVFMRCGSCEGRGWSVQHPSAFSKGASSGIFSMAADPPFRHLVAVGGDYSKPNQRGSAAFTGDRKSWQPAQTPPHGYRSSVAYDAAAKTWITVGPNGTDISTDDGKTWRPLQPDPARHETADADRNWNALSLPFVVGPHGRVGKLNPNALKP